MKHLKIFEKFIAKKEGFYINIQSEEYYEIIDDSIKMDTNIYRRISKFGEENRTNTFSHVDWRGRHAKIFYIGSRMIDIHQLDDEYFAVRFRIDERGDLNIFYKCDQLDGVFELFKDLEIKWR